MSKPHPPIVHTPDEVATDLAELVSKILTTSERVEVAVREILAGRSKEKVEAGRVDDSFDTYMKEMSSLQFGKTNSITVSYRTTHNKRFAYFKPLDWI